MIHDFIDRLRTQTKTLHQQAHTLSFFRELANGHLAIESYVTLLRCLAIVRGTLERQCRAVGGKAAHVFGPDRPGGHLLRLMPTRLPVILNDLQYFSNTRIRDVVPAVRAALRSADTIMMQALTDPFRLLGAIYTLEGSTNGGRVIAPQVERGLALKRGEGTAYLHSIDAPDHPDWPTFLDLLRQSAQEPTEQEQVIAGARDMFTALVEVFAALHPLDESMLGYHVVSLNPEAGNHEIPTDPHEIECALTAARACWHEFGYYERRYGERGRRFAASDSAWLVAMARLEQPLLDEQIVWLANLLAARGMPRTTMVAHLRLLHEELAREIPEKAAAYRGLHRAADMLDDIRRQYVDDATFARLADEIDRALPADLAPQWRRLGELLVSAVADEMAGVSDVVAPLMTWMSDASGLPATTLTVMRAVVERARPRSAAP